METERMNFCNRSSLRTTALTLFLFLTLSNCQKSVPHESYFETFEKQYNRHTAVIVRNGIAAELSYLPNELYAARDMQVDTGLSVLAAMKRYENTLFLLLKIRTQDDNGRSNRLRRIINNSACYMSNDIFLTDSNDTIPLTTYRYEPSRGIGNPDEFILAFSRKMLMKRSTEYNLIFRNISPELGTLEFGLDKIIKKIPKLRG